MTNEITNEITNNRITLLDLLSDTILKNAANYIRQYESETDALIFTEGLVAIRGMLISTKIQFDGLTDYRKLLISQELELHIKQVNSIIRKTQKRRPMSRITRKDRLLLLEINRDFKNIFGKDYDIFNDIAPFLLETSKR